MRTCPRCKIKMVLREYFAPVADNVIGGTGSLPIVDASVDVFTNRTYPYLYWECPKCGYTEVASGTKNVSEP